MPARIRLQIKGSPSNPFYWIIIQSSKKGHQGHEIERMGHWIPDNKGVFKNRSIILNRPRLKYWLGTGAEPTKGVQRLLSKVGFFPKKPPPFGTSCLYEKPQWVDPPEKIKLTNYGAANPYREKVEQMLKANEERKKSYLDNAHNQFAVRNSQPVEQDIQKYIETYSNYLEKIKEMVPNDAKSKSEFFVKLMGLLKFNRTDISKKRLMEELNITEAKAKKILKIYSSVQMLFTKADLDDFKYDLSVKNGRGIKPGDKFYVPSKNPITPYPDFESAEPFDYPPKLFGIKNTVTPNEVYGIEIEPIEARVRRKLEREKINKELIHKTHNSEKYKYSKRNSDSDK